MFCQAHVKVIHPFGLHLRPASRIAAVASEFPGVIHMRYGDRCADAQSILSILQLGVPEGGEVSIEADRFDAPAIVEQISQLTAGLSN